MTLSPATSRGSASSGGATVIQTIGPVNNSPATLDFTAIPQTFNTLLLYGVFKDTFASGFVVTRFNGDASTNYDFGTLTQGSTTVTGANTAANGGITVTSSGNAIFAGNPGIFELIIPGYALTTFRKVCFARSGYDSATPVTSVLAVGEWLNTAAITEITLVPGGSNWVNGTVATLYGL